MNYEKSKFYIIGGGIAGLSTAVYLIQEGKVNGKNITIFDKAKRFGGALDAKETKNGEGYTMRGIRVFEKRAYTAFMDLIGRIPTEYNRTKTLKDEFLEFNKEKKVNFIGRLTRDKKIVDAKKLELDIKDRLKLMKLLSTKEEKLENIKIKEYFSEDIFKTNFWFEFSTVFAFIPDHSVLEMKRYLLRSIHCFQYFDTLEPLQITPLNQYESLVLPIINYLKKNQVNFSANTRIENFEFKKIYDKKFVKKIYLTKEENKEEIVELEKNDYVFTALGSMKANSSIGDMENAPKKKTENLSGSWQLWKNIVKDNPEFGNPEVFTNDVKKTSWTSFTITFKDSVIRDLIKPYINGVHTAFAGTTFVDSKWGISLGFHLEDYFKNQEKDTLIAWGYTISPQNEGNYIKKKIEDCSGREILEELIYHLGLENHKEEIMKTSICIPDYTPYVTSQFVATKKGDKPEVIPGNSLNFGFLGQFVEMKDDIVFTVEYSVRTAQKAVYELLKLDKKVSKIPNFLHNPKVILNFIKTSLK